MAMWVIIVPVGVLESCSSGCRRYVVCGNGLQGRVEAVQAGMGRQQAVRVRKVVAE